MIMVETPGEKEAVADDEGESPYIVGSQPSLLAAVMLLVLLSPII